jgi:hypothetical protein
MKKIAAKDFTEHVQNLNKGANYSKGQSVWFDFFLLIILAFYS